MDGLSRNLLQCLLLLLFTSHFYTQQTEEPKEDPSYMNPGNSSSQEHKTKKIKRSLLPTVSPVTVNPLWYKDRYAPLLEAADLNSVLNQLYAKSILVPPLVQLIVGLDIKGKIIAACYYLVLGGIDPLPGLTGVIFPTTTTVSPGASTTSVSTSLSTTAAATSSLAPTTTLPTSTSTSTPSSTSVVSTSTPASSFSPITPEDIAGLLAKLLEEACSSSAGPEVIDSLSNIVASIPPDGCTEASAQLVLSILGNFTNNALISGRNFDMGLVTKNLQITSQVLGKLTTTEQNLQMLQNFEKSFSTMKASDKPSHVVLNGLDLSCTVFYPDDLHEDGHVELLSGAAVSLPTETINNSSGNPINVLSLIYRPENYTFTTPVVTSNGPLYSLASSIWTNVAIVNNKSDHSVNIQMNFSCYNNLCDETALCMFLNVTSNEWSPEGCNTTYMNGTLLCSCRHLTSFSILMSNSIPQDNKTPVMLDLITKTLLPISIGSLLSCIAIQALLITQVKSSVALYRHVCILHMAVFLLISNGTFLASSLFEVESHHLLCIILTFFTHFSLLAFFSWTLVQGIFLVWRLLFVFHHITKKQFMWLAGVLGYLFPTSVAGSAFLLYYPHKYLKVNACWLDNRYGASMFFNIPAMMIMSGNMVILVIVVAKVLTPSVSEDKSEDDEVVRKLMKAVLFCTPQFGLTWAIGIPLYLYPQATFLHYLFAMLNPLQGFFLLLFGCLLDKKVIITLKEIFKSHSSPSRLESTFSNT